MNLSKIQSKSTNELQVLAQDIGIDIEGNSNKRHDLLSKILSAYAEKDDSVQANGVLSVSKDGYGFLRTYSEGSTSIGSNGSSSDVYVSQSQIRKHSLRPGDMVLGDVRAPKDGERYFGLVNVDSINDLDSALSTLRSTAQNLGSNAAVLSLRLDFTKNLINSLSEGSSKLVNADLNEESANLLTLQTRQQLGTIGLSIAQQSEQSILRLF